MNDDHICPNLHENEYGETSTDIAEEMREGFNKSWYDVNREWAHGLADRIEAAEKRERGNVAAMRDALTEIRCELNGYCNGCTLLDRMTENPPDYTCLRDSLLEIERIVEAALAVPPRNCEMADDHRK